MLYTGYDGPKLESYKDYKYKTREKFLKRARELMSGIKSCSLKGEDKEKLRKEILEILKQQ